MTINDIAVMAGVSKATVSRYLNNGYVSEEKKKRISKAIEATGYVPSAQAQILRTKKSKIIGVILPKINSDAISRVVDGIILIGTILTAEHKSLIRESCVPIVVIGQYIKECSSVYHDDYNASKDVTRVMIKNGRKHIGYIGVTLLDEAAGRNRYMGYKDAFLAFRPGEQISLDENAMIVADFSIKDGYQKARELLARVPDIDGLFCATDSIAIGAMEYIKEQGKKIPRDIQIVGIGDTNMSRVVTPHLTTVHLPYKTSGIEGAKLLITMIEQKNRIIREIKMGYRVILEESTR